MGNTAKSDNSKSENTKKESSWRKKKFAGAIAMAITATALLAEITILSASFLANEELSDLHNQVVAIFSISIGAFISVLIFTIGMFGSLSDKKEIIAEIQSIKSSIDTSIATSTNTLTNQLSKNHQELIDFLDKRLPPPPPDE